MPSTTQAPQDNGQALITGLLKLVQGAADYSPLAMASRAAGSWAGQPSGQNPVPGMAQAAAQVGPYQKGVSKALSAAGEAHATEALQSGIPPEQIQAHPIMNAGSPQGDNALNALSQTGQGQANGQYLGYQPPAQTPQAAPQAQAPITPQHLDLLHSILTGAGMAGMNAAGIGNYQNQMAQTAQLKQQTQNITPQGALALKTAEAAAPLSTQQLAEYQGTAYGKQLEASSKQVEESNKALDNATQQLKAISEFTPIYQKLAPVEHNKIVQGYQSMVQKMTANRDKYMGQLNRLKSAAPLPPQGGDLNGGVLHQDANGNKAYKMPDGSWRQA